ncbi:MAG: hypothetical protein JF617_17015 [Burkholderiales bacterium]|nr:hypothetical protein [Burkholderiales bacterium]
MNVMTRGGRWLLALVLGLTALMGSARAADVVLNTTQDSFYPRMIRLAASGAANGRLLASHDLGGSQSLIYESTNQGASWAQVGSITVPETWHCCSTLWEVPQASTAAPTWAARGRSCPCPPPAPPASGSPSSQWTAPAGC